MDCDVTAKANAIGHQHAISKATNVHITVIAHFTLDTGSKVLKTQVTAQCAVSLWKLSNTSATLIASYQSFTYFVDKDIHSYFLPFRKYEIRIRSNMVAEYKMVCTRQHTSLQSDW